MRMTGEGEESRSNEQPIDSGRAVGVGIVVLIVTGLGGLTRGLRLSGLHRNGWRLSRRRETRHNIDSGLGLVFLARGLVLQTVGEEVRSIGLSTSPDLRLSEGWTEQPREKTQKNGGPGSVHIGPLNLLYTLSAPCKPPMDFADLSA